MSAFETSYALRLRGLTDREFRFMIHLGEAAGCGSVTVAISRFAERLECTDEDVRATAYELAERGIIAGLYVSGRSLRVERIIGKPDVFGPMAPAATRVPETKKKKIPQSLRTQVFERDGYRCVDCGTHLDLRCDHEIPESKGGPTTLENLRTRCALCNSRKGTKMPAGAPGDV